MRTCPRPSSAGDRHTRAAGCSRLRRRPQMHVGGDGDDVNGGVQHSIPAAGQPMAVLGRAWRSRLVQFRCSSRMRPRRCGLPGRPAGSRLRERDTRRRGGIDAIVLAPATGGRAHGCVQSRLTGCRQLLRRGRSVTASGDAQGPKHCPPPESGPATASTRSSTGRSRRARPGSGANPDPCWLPGSTAVVVCALVDTDDDHRGVSPCAGGRGFPLSAFRLPATTRW